MLDGTQSWFRVPEVTMELIERVRTGDIHPSGPMWGRGRSPAQGESGAFEDSVLESFGFWKSSLEIVGLSQERRALRVIPAGFTWQMGTDDLILEFTLPPGCYATSVLRECFRFQDAAEENSRVELVGP